MSSSSVQALDPAGVVSFISARPQLASRVGPPGSEGQWTVKEVGDGNINFVYIVQVEFCADRVRSVWVGAGVQQKHYRVFSRLSVALRVALGMSSPGQHHLQ